MRRLMRVVMCMCLLVSVTGLMAQGIKSSGQVVYNVTDYGVVSDGETMNTEKIQAVIDDVAAAGGGTVYFPPGKYLTGTIFLKSHINLHLENGAVILGSLDINDYKAVGVERLNHSARQQRHLIYAGDEEGIAITGRGIVDGRGPEFWPKDFRTMTEIEIRGAMTQPDGFSTRPGGYVVIQNCTDVWIENVTFRDSPHHMMKIINCTDVVLHGMSIEQGVYEDDGPNTDGLAISGFNIRISDCKFTTGDDCMVISGAEHFTMSNCTFTTTESAIVMSGSKGGLKSVAISNCSILDAGGAFTIRPGRENVIDGVTVSNINYRLDRQMGGNLIFCRAKPIEVRESVTSWAEKWNIKVKPDDGPPPKIRNMTFSNITASGDGAIFMDGLPDSWIENITLENIKFHMRGAIPKPDSAVPPHPYYIFGHHFAPYGIFCRYIKNLTMRNIRFTWNEPEKAEWGSALRVWDGANIEIDGFNGRQSLGSDRAAIELQNVQGAFIRNGYAAEGTGTFLHLNGSSNVTLMNNHLGNALQVLKYADGSSADDVAMHGNITGK
jgi:hypothetical protein